MAARIVLAAVAVALIGLATFQSTDPPHGPSVAIGVATKLLVAIGFMIVAFRDRGIGR